jgi:hypothetical protein
MIPSSKVHKSWKVKLVLNLERKLTCDEFWNSKQRNFVFFPFSYQ